MRMQKSGKSHMNSGALYIAYSVFQVWEFGIALTMKCKIFIHVHFFIKVHDLGVFLLVVSFCKTYICFW